MAAATSSSLTIDSLAEKLLKDSQENGLDIERVLQKAKEILDKMNEEKEEFHVDPINIRGVVDYAKLCDQFGCSLLTDDLVKRMEKLTGKRTHPMVRRRLYYAHRDLDLILDAYEKNGPSNSFYLYTGRGPSASSLHVGHCIPFILNRYLQRAFQVPIVIQVTDDEKFFWKDEIDSMEKSYNLARENIKDIIAFGFDIRKTFILIDSRYMGHDRAFYKNVVKVQEKVTSNQISKIFGLDGNDTVVIGKVAYPPIQAIPSFPDSFPIMFGGKKDLKCLIPCAIDQDPYFRMTRDVAPKLGQHKCACLYSRFIPSLEGPEKGGKMSASDKMSAIYLNDSAELIRDKIKKRAYSGGQETLELQRKLGAKDIENDVSFQYLSFFSDDDELLERVRRDYTSGKMLTGEVKNILCDTLIPWIQGFQERRKKVTDEMVDAFMALRLLTF